MGRSHFESAEDYVAWVENPRRVVYVEWRKVRHEKSRGLTSHSWLEVSLLDGRRLRLEIYADQGYTELHYDPANKSDSRFFDPQSTLYDDRAAESQDLARPLTAETLTREAKELARRRPYSLSEFNCHHFVLELWNSMVVDRLKSQHYPDRAKIGLLWGFEEVVGPWLQGVAASVGRPMDPRSAANGRVKRPKDFCGKRSGVEVARSTRLALSCAEIQRQTVYVLETTGPLLPTQMPSAARQSSASFFDLTSAEQRLTAWSAAFLPGVEDAANPLMERLNRIDVTAAVAELSPNRTRTAPNLSMVSSMSIAPVASLSSLQSQPPADDSLDMCFVVLCGRELRLAIHALLREPGGVWSWLVMLSGDAKKGQEGNYCFALRELPERGCIRAVDLAIQEQESFQQALRRSSWTTLLPNADA